MKLKRLGSDHTQMTGSDRVAHILAELEPVLAALRALDYTPYLFAVVLSGAIGLEREMHGRPAGLRTHILVCLCSTMVISVSRMLAMQDIDLGDGGRLVFDPNRMGAGIVTGIGFLGAATVLRSGDVLRGLTTAACIWYVAGLGIVLGSGFYALGVVGSGVVLFVLTFINTLSRFIRPVIYRRLVIECAGCTVGAVVEQVRAALREQDVQVKDIASNSKFEPARTELTFYVSLKNKLQAPALVEQLVQLGDVVSVRWRLIS